MSAPASNISPSIGAPTVGADTGLLRLITCGSVDDGKSTLIGRMLLDSKAVYLDQLDAVHRTSLAKGHQQTDLALLTDGLRAEREQGITIDVAYRYFSTPRRKFILADTPGHVQYTRNMVTGASTANAAIILIDARQGVIEQTRRHACLVALLGIPHLVVCVNKMDLVKYDEGRFEEIKSAFEAFANSARPDRSWTIAQRCEATFFPISALSGDQVVKPSPQMPWFTGPTLLAHLETLPTQPAQAFAQARLSVQYVIRPQRSEHHDYRGYAGQIASGEFRVGDEVLALPGGQRSRVTRIHIGPQDVAGAFAPQSVALALADDVDIARGDMLVHADSVSGASGQAPKVTRDIEATLVWMHAQPLAAGKRVIVKHATRSVAAVVQSIGHRLNIQTLEVEPTITQLGLNEIARATLRLAAPIVCDPYDSCRSTGGFIVIDEQSNNTIGAGLIR